MDHLPELPAFPLFTSYADWFVALQAWMPRAATPERIGAREIQPGVWIGLHTRIAADAQLRAPCWIGDHVYVGHGAIVGPMAIIERAAFVEPGVEISYSLIGPETFVGQCTEVRHSLACGGTLVNWKLDSCIKVPDAFLLCSLGRAKSPFKSVSPFARFAAALTILLTLPFAVGAALRSKLRGLHVLRPMLAVRPGPPDSLRLPGDTLLYYELTGTRGWLRRWPQLWNILFGDFSWIGNRPVGPRQSNRLANDFERLWLAAPLGIISLADAEGCNDFSSDETRAHASYYAVWIRSFSCARCSSSLSASLARRCASICSNRRPASRRSISLPSRLLKNKRLFNLWRFNDKMGP